MARKKATKVPGEPTDLFQRRLATAVRAGWCTVLIWFCLLMVSWLIWLVFMHVQPEWVHFLWGGKLEWSTMQEMTLWFYGVFKMMLWAFVMVVLFLTLWLRGLKRA